MADCLLRKRFEWCKDIESRCSAILNRFKIDVEGSEDFCKILSLGLLPSYRYLRYVDNTIKVSDVPTEFLLFLRRCGFSIREIADLLNTTTGTVEERFRSVARDVDERAGLISAIVEAGTENILKSLESKWMQLHEMRDSTDEDIQLKAIKLQLEVERAITEEKERVVSLERLVKFMSVMEDKIIEADMRLREQVGLANKILSLEGRPQIPYVSIVREVRRAIESDKELAAISQVLSDTPLSAKVTE